MAIFKIEEPKSFFFEQSNLSVHRCGRVHDKHKKIRKHRSNGVITTQWSSQNLVE